MKSESFSSGGCAHSFEQRVRNIERLLLFSLMFAASYLLLINQYFILEEYLGKTSIYLHIVLFTISYFFAVFYFSSVFFATLDEVGIQFEKFVFKHKYLISISLVCIIVLSGILILQFVFEYELKEVLGPIIISLIMIVITKFTQISAWIKERLEQKQLDDYN